MMKNNSQVLYPALIFGVHLPLILIFMAIVFFALKPHYKKNMKPIQIQQQQQSGSGDDGRPKTPELQRGQFVVPPYWTDVAKVELGYIDVTANADPIKQLVYSLWQPQEVAVGRDVDRSCRLKYIHIRKVQRIQNFALYQMYYEKKKMLERKTNYIDYFKDLGTVARAPVKTTDKMCSTPELSTLLVGLDRHLNEHYLFHGTRNTSSQFIWRQGLSTHFAAKGLFGKGVYMAEDPTKSDQYTDGTRTNNILLLCRVCLGEIYVQRNTANADELESPPCRTCYLQNCPVHNNLTFDSVVTEVPGMRFREYIVYRDYRVYPEYIITFDRVPDDRQMRGLGESRF